MGFHITVARCRGLAPEQPISLPIPVRGLMLGRNPDNDLPLSDPERVVSGTHARIEVRDGAPWITDQSTNGTFLNQAAERLPTHQPVRLHDGDLLSIGPYEVLVSETPEPGDPWQPAPRRPPVSELLLDVSDAHPLPGLPDAAPNIMDLLGPAVPGPATPPPGDAPFADAFAMDQGLTGPAAPADAPLAVPPPTPFEHVYCRPPEVRGPGPDAAAAAPPATTPALVPDDYDLLADTLGTPTTAGAAASWPSIEAELPESPGPATRPETWAAQVEPPPPPFTAPPAGPDPADLAAGPARATPAPVTTGSSDAGLAAFLAGLGTGSPAQIANPEQFLADAGRLMRELTLGLTATMQARARFKSELRLGVTTIRAAENNPYKFSVGVDEALERLLLRPGPAYLPALIAARGAFADIQAHEMAMIAGLRAALRALLARFEPAELERRLGAAKGLDKLLPMARKASYWDLFTETFDQVAADAADDFMQLFGDAFTRAYEDQVMRLTRAQGPGAGSPGKRP
jgi:type VI secretion system protein